MARVLLLTAPEQAREIAFLLEEEGHEPCFLPLLAGPAELPRGLRAAAEQLPRLTWVISTARAPVRAFLEAVHGAGTRGRLSKLQWLVPDAATARAVERVGGAARVPGDGKWTSAVSGLVTSDDEVLVLHDEAPVPEVLLDSLDAAGCHFVVVQVPSAQRPVDLSLARSAGVVLVHSPAAGEVWAELSRGGEAHPADDACCGPVQPRPAPASALGGAAAVRVVAGTQATAEVLSALGVEVFTTARAGTADALVDAALEALA
ncbi:MAG: uroporphyrinogen-III synthase [Myxococcota bacterium]